MGQITVTIPGSGSNLNDEFEGLSYPDLTVDAPQPLQPVAPAQLPVPLTPQEAETGAGDIVRDGFSSAQAYAAGAFNEAVSFLGRLETVIDSITNLPDVNETLSGVDTAISEFTMPVVPASPDTTMNLPPTPLDPTIVDVGALTIPDAPVFSAQAPTLDLPAAPGALTDVPPTSPGVQPVAVPDMPDVPLPDVPTLLGIDIPAAPLLDMPTFTAVKPDSPLAPAYIFAFAETRYTTDLITALRSRLAQWVDGAATGIDPAVEGAIWERTRSREAAAAARKVIEAQRNAARLGFTKPPGAMNIEIAQALQDQQDAVITSSRETAIKQADLEQSNRRFAIEQAWKMEADFLTYESNLSQRALEAAKYAQQAGIDIYREEVNAYRADIEAYVAEAEILKARIQAELGKLEVFKAQIEAQRLIGTINEQVVNVYRARVDAAKAVVDIFKARIEAANVQATVNKTIIEAFAAEVGAYAERVRAKAAEYQGYATRVQAEVARTEIFTAQANAYSAQVQGYKAGIEAQVEGKRVELDIAKFPLEVFKARTEVFGELVRAEGTRLDAIAKTHTADAQMFDSEVRGESSRVQSDVERVKALTEAAVAGANLRIESAKANVQKLIQQATLLSDTMRAGAQAAAQVAAAALSTVNMSTQIGTHTSYSTSNAQSTSLSSSVSTQTSTVASVSASTGYSRSNQKSEIQQSTSVTQYSYNRNYNYSE